MDPLTRALVPVWGVLDPTGKPLFTSTDRLAAEEVAEKNTTYSEVPLLTLPPVAVATTQMSRPFTHETFAKSQGATMGATSSSQPLTKEAVQPLVDATNRLIKRLNIPISVKIIVHDGPITFQELSKKTGKLEWVTTKSLGLARIFGKDLKVAPGKWSDITQGEIHISLQEKENHRAEVVWATLTHEMGHIIMWTIYRTASEKVRNAVDAAWKKTYFEKMKLTMTMDEVYQLQSTAAYMVDRVLRGAKTPTTLSQLPQDQVDYWTGFSEWFAEQTAKWATTSQEPLSVVEKFFKGMATRLMAMLKIASDMFGMHYETVPALKAFLDGALQAEAVQAMGPQVATITTQETTIKNNTQMAPEDAAVEVRG